MSAADRAAAAAAALATRGPRRHDRARHRHHQASSASGRTLERFGIALRSAGPDRDRAALRARPAAELRPAAGPPRRRSRRCSGWACAASAGATSRSCACRRASRPCASTAGPRHGPSSWAWGGSRVSISHEGDYAVAIAFGVRTTGGRYVFPLDIEERLDDRERQILARMERLRETADDRGMAEKRRPAFGRARRAADATPPMPRRSSTTRRSRRCCRRARSAATRASSASCS